MTVRELRNMLDDIEEQDVEIVLIVDDRIVTDMDVIELEDDECEENELEIGTIAIVE